MLKNSQWSQNHKAQTFWPAFWDIILSLSFQLSLLTPPQWSTFLVFLDSISLLLPFPFLFARELPHPKHTAPHTLKTQQKCLFSLPAWEGLLSLNCQCILFASASPIQRPAFPQLHLLFSHLPIWNMSSRRAGLFLS